MTDTSTHLPEPTFGASASGHVMGRAAERSFTDRRKRPTPMLSRYWLRGQRRQAGRRDGESQRIYVDRYTRKEAAVAAWVIAASLADLGLTLLHLQGGGTEANPIMDWFLTQGGTAAFAAAKLLMTAVPVLFLLLHVRFRGTWPALLGLSAMYLALMGYHAVAAWDRLSGG